MRRAALAAAVLAGACSRSDPTAPPSQPTPPAKTTPAPPASGALVPLPAPPASLGLSPVYVRYVDVETVPVVGSARASDHGVREAAFIVRRMIGHRPEVLRAIAHDRVRVVVMAASELTTDVPEHADLVPKDYWDRRARGLGATLQRPATSCGEENLLELPGDPYAAENILVHEFAHTIHERGMRAVDPTFDGRLQAAYEHARSTGLWSNTYAMENRNEYWAEGAQSWFDTNRANDREHGPIDTRAKLKPYDPMLAALLAEVFGDGPWRYQRPSQRPREGADGAHLAGLDRKALGSFSWPARLPAVASAALAAQPVLPLLPPARAPRATPPGETRATSVAFFNGRARDISLDWLDFTGTPRHYADVRPGLSAIQSTFAGHVWIVREGTTLLGAVVATENAARVDVR